MNKLLYLGLIGLCTGCTFSCIEMNFPEGTYKEVLEIVIEREEPLCTN